MRRKTDNLKDKLQEDLRMIQDGKNNTVIQIYINTGMLRKN